MAPTIMTAAATPTATFVDIDIAEVVVALLYKRI